MGTQFLIDSNQSKKRRITYDENNGEDIISYLPECITSRILSRLPTKDALRTCVLSKDWEHKWTGIYNIDIDDDMRFVLKKTRKTSFINFVDRIFFLSRNSTLKRFSLRCHLEYKAHRMISWISAALMRNVADLEIVYHDDDVVLPARLFSCTSLTTMKLKWPCFFRVSYQNLFSSLKSLYLDRTKFLGECVPGTRKLVFDFPVLETLELQNCEWLKVNLVEINAPALSMFKVICYSYLLEVDKCQIKFSKAKLVKCEFVGRFVEDFDFSATSVFSATIDFRSYYNDDIHLIRKIGLQAGLLFKGFCGLNHLKISGKVVEAVVQSNQRPLLPKFNMLKRLEVFTKCNSGALLELLHPMPFLKSIVLEMWCWDDYDYDEVESLPSCIVSHLKEVRFRSFSESLPDYRMAQFLWTNALRLKKIVGLRRESSEERQRKKIFGQVREESEEKEIENFWAKLKTVFKHKEHGIFVKRKKR
ncbi:F-box/LRR-repeat protein At3g59190-like isoform X1 [Primulina eburnea]|uniref:F-box/LRR-repeat protein At3g59190-like isoform X1 n=1 Tax=Primulina eburnea TaxID=1245227 RepID=UPI003C6CA84B